MVNFELGNNDIAEEDLKMAIDLDPQDSRSMYNLATYYYQIKSFKRAEVQIKKALQIEPNNQEAKYLYALILKELGRMEESNRLMRELQAS